MSIQISTDNLLSNLPYSVLVTLIDTYAGCTIYIPTCIDVYSKSERNNNILLDKINGLSTIQLARKYGLCTRQITRILFDGTAKLTKLSKNAPTAMQYK